MSAVIFMEYLHDLGLDLETTMAVMRLDYSQDEINEAIMGMPPEVWPGWVETMRLVAVPKKSKSF